MLFFFYLLFCEIGAPLVGNSHGRLGGGVPSDKHRCGASADGIGVAIFAYKGLAKADALGADTFELGDNLDVAAHKKLVYKVHIHRHKDYFQTLAKHIGTDMFGDEGYAADVEVLLLADVIDVAKNVVVAKASLNGGAGNCSHRG